MSKVAVNMKKRTISPTASDRSMSDEDMMPPPTLKRQKRTYKPSSKNKLVGTKVTAYTPKTDADGKKEAAAEKSANKVIKQAVVLRTAMVYRALRGDICPRSKNYNLAVGAGIPPIARGWRERLAISNNEDRFDLALRLLAEAYVIVSVAKCMAQDEKLAMIRDLDTFYVQALEISRVDCPALKQHEAETEQIYAKITNRLSGLALNVAKSILDIGMGRLISLDKETRRLFLRLQLLVLQARRMDRNSDVIEMGRSLLTLIFLDDRFEGKNISPSKSSASLKQMIGMIMKKHALSVIHEESKQ